MAKVAAAPSQEQQDRVQDIQEARIAQGVRKYIVHFVGLEEDKITSLLIGQYRMGALSGEAAARGIAELSALHNLVERIDTVIQRGNISEEMEVERGTR